jgi:hypothetical protein
MKVQRAGHRLMRLHVFEAGGLQCAVRRDIQRVGLAIQAADAQRVEINLGALSDKERPVAGLSLFRLKDVQMHVGFLSEDDLVGAGEAGGLPLDLPHDREEIPCFDRQSEVALEDRLPLRAVGQGAKGRHRESSEIRAKRNGSNR